MVVGRADIRIRNISRRKVSRRSISDIQLKSERRRNSPQVTSPFPRSALLNSVSSLMCRNTGQSEKKSSLCLVLLLKGKHLCGAQERMEDVGIAASTRR